MAPEREDRRLAAILAADMVGYSRLMEADERGTIARQKAHRKELIDPKISEHNGRIFKTMGDGLLVEFASVVDATECAVAIQRGMTEREADVPEERRIQYRVGINLGDIVIDGDDILGDGVNLAARLQTLAEPGGICVARNVFNQVKNKLELGFADLGPQTVKNIAEPVATYHVLLNPTDSGKLVLAKQRAPTRRRWVAGAAAAISVLIVAGVAWWRPWVPRVESASAARIAFPLPKKASMAVLPFKNLTGNSAEDYFTDGITEDIINALGRYRPIAILAYNTARSYRNTQKSPEEIGRALKVRYIVVGSVRRTGVRVRVSARLIDANRGVLLWSKKFDEEKKDIFALQDAITRQIAGTLVANLTRLEQRRAIAKPTQNLDAYDLVLRGRAQLARASRSGNRKARRLFQKALELDPRYAAALAWLARAHYHTAIFGWTEFAAQALKRAEKLAQKALSIDPEVVEAHRTLGRVYAIQFQLDRAIAEIDRAIELNPSDAEARGDRGLILMWIGRLKDSVSALETAFAFDPNLGPDYVFAHGLAQYTLRRHLDAIRILERGAARYSKHPLIPAVLVAAYGQLGRMTEARRNADKVKRLFPIFDPTSFGARFQNREHHKFLTEGLAKGGMK